MVNKGLRADRRGRLTGSYSQDYSLCRPIHRGRSHEASCWRDRMRRLRAGLVTPHSGGPGTGSGGIRTPPRGARWTGTGANASSQETRTRGQKSPRWRAAGRAPLRQRVPALRQARIYWMRRVVLHPLRPRPKADERPAPAGREDGVPGADKEYGRFRLFAAYPPVAGRDKCGMPGICALRRRFVFGYIRALSRSG